MKFGRLALGGPGGCRSRPGRRGCMHRLQKAPACVLGWKRREDPGWVKGWLLSSAQLSIVLGKFLEDVLDQTQPATNAPGFVCPSCQQLVHACGVKQTTAVNLKT